MKTLLIALALGTGLAAVPIEAATYNFAITGQFTGSGSFTTLDTESEEIPGGYSITAMTGTFNGSAITGIRPVGTLYADNMYFADGLHVDEDGWTFHAGTHDYNMFLSEITDADGTREQLLIGYPGIGASRHVNLAVTQVSAPVPEPAMLYMLGVGGIGIALKSRRRKIAEDRAAA